MWSLDLLDIHTKLQQIESNTEGGGTLHLSNSIKQVEDVANRAFSPLLERQVQEYMFFIYLFLLCPYNTYIIYFIMDE